MGFNTVAVLYNDCTHEYRAAGQLGTRIAHAMTAGWLERERPGMGLLGLHFGAGKVISQASADYYQVVVVAKNTGWPISEANDLDWMALEGMADCLRRHGWSVSREQKKARLKSAAG